MTDIQDATVVPDDPDADEQTIEPQHTPPAAATSLAVRPSREALAMVDPDQVIESMRAYQDMLPKLLEPSDFQDAGDGKRFVKRSGWRKIARAFNLSIVIVDRRVERDEDGNVVRAEVVCRAIAPNGQCQDGDGYCSSDESRFKTAKGRQKLEQDLRATATTRAKSRAISDLIGMGDVEDTDPDRGTGQDASPELQQAATDALASLLQGDAHHVGVARQRLDQQFSGRAPAVAAQTIVILDQVAKRQRAGTTGAPA